MRSTVALVLAAVLMVAASPVAALAGTATNVALGLASFAVFNQVVGARVVVGAPVVAGPVGYLPPGGFVAAPPPVPVARVDAVSVRPGRGHAWVPGRWVWRGAPHGYAWIGGHWTVPARRHAAWVPGHWAWGRAGYVWVDGHWAGPR